MPKLQFRRWLGSFLPATEPMACSHKVTSPAAASVYEWLGFHAPSSTYEVQSSQKLSQAEDIWTGKIRTFDAETEHYGALAPANDFPAPLLCEDVVIDLGFWMQFTLVGWTNKANCDMPPLAQLQVYEAVNIGNGCVTPPGGYVLMNMSSGELIHYFGRNNSQYGGTFTGIVRGWLGTIPSVWEGHDRGAQDPGPPPIPPDTVHDPIGIYWPPKTALLGFMATSSAHASVIARPIPYAPPGSHCGIFMPIIMRYLADRWITKTVTKTVTKLISKTRGTPPVAVPDPSILPRPEETRKVTPGGGVGFGSPIDSTADEGETQRDYGEQPDRNGPGGYLML